MHTVFFLSLLDRMFLILTILKMKEGCPRLIYIGLPEYLVCFGDKMNMHNTVFVSLKKTV